METKKCGKCGIEKPLSEFYTHRQWGHQSYCKACKKLYREQNIDKSRAYSREYGYRKGNKHPMETATDSASYLGVYIAERALSKFFDDIRRMPNGNPGYDFICRNGYKIDVKSSCRHHRNHSPIWEFGIRRNTKADYFLLVAFDDRESLNPEHVWLIPGHVINDHSGLGITDTLKGLSRFSEYEKPLDRLIEGCEAIRNETGMEGRCICR